MSKLIVEMDMPKACRWDEDGKTKRCPIAEWGGACAVTKMFEPSFDNRPSWCPICGVLPDEHGDLIDRDALLETCIYYNIDQNHAAVDADNIQDMPVIIAAERKDDEH